MIKATKYSVYFTVEVLDLKSVACMIHEALELFRREYSNGEISATDGDKVVWSVEEEKVDI